MKGNEPGGNRYLEGLSTPLQTVRNKVTEASLLTGSGRKSERVATAVMKRYKTETHLSFPNFFRNEKNVHAPV